MWPGHHSMIPWLLAVLDKSSKQSTCVAARRQILGMGYLYGPALIWSEMHDHELHTELTECGVVSEISEILECCGR